MDLIRMGEATRVLDVHRNTLVRWETEGRVTPLRGPGRVRFYRPEDIERLRKSREPKAEGRES